MTSYDEQSYALRQALQKGLADKDIARLTDLLNDPLCKKATMNTDASLVHWVDKAFYFVAVPRS